MKNFFYFFSLLKTRSYSTPGGRFPDEKQLTEVCIVLYTQQKSTDKKLHRLLSECRIDLTEEFFLQICNRFPLSWLPVYRFFKFTEEKQKENNGFVHTTLTFNKMADVMGRSRNSEKLWGVVEEMGRRGLVNEKTFIIAVKNLAWAKELRKCVEVFHCMNKHGYLYCLRTLNKTVGVLCERRMVEEARYIVVEMKKIITPSVETYTLLIKGFCRIGEVLEAAELWNLMMKEGLEPEADAGERMMEALFKMNKAREAIKLFESMRDGKVKGVGPTTYGLAVTLMSKRGRTCEAFRLFSEMRRRGMTPDKGTVSAMVYGLVARGRVIEGVSLMDGADARVYHGLMKGLLKLKKKAEATEVFRTMIREGCEPTMHTYVMLLQAHMGAKGVRGRNVRGILVNFDTVFVGGLVKAGRVLEAQKFVERVMGLTREVPRFDYNRFLYYFSNEDGVKMFEKVSVRMREAGLVDLADIFQRYGERMTTRERRRIRPARF